MVEVMLGMPGPWADDKYEVADHYSAKIGGLPDWPIPNITIVPDLLECRACKSKLCLLSQIYAPVSSKSLTIEERILYVFGCVMPGCGNRPSSWRVLRVQKSVGSEERNPPTSSSLSAPKNDWKENLWSFDSVEDDVGGSNDDIDLEELGRALSEAASLSSSSKKQSCDPETPVKLSTADHKSRVTNNNFPVLPCFYIYAQEEKIFKEIRHLSSKYSSDPIIGNAGDLDEHSSEETWEEESYEYDRALNADRTYLKFKKRLDAYPEQCFRYSYGGKPLLATLEEGNSGNCSLCGGSRQYEMQLMPPVLYFLQEATNGQPQNILENWNWMTLIVYTCSKSCAHSSHQEKSGNEGWIVAEEAVVVQFE